MQRRVGLDVRFRDDILVPLPHEGKRPADAVVGNRQLSACVLGLPYDRLWVDFCRSALSAVG